MRIAVLVVLALLACYVTAQQEHYPFWKVTCEGTPLYRGRADPIVDPGSVSNHVHKVFGASNFDKSSASETPLQLYKRIFDSNCTTCSITIDKSNYWVADMYYQWPNGSLQLVPYSGLTVYYLARAGTGNQTNPKFTAFPPGFRMIAGYPFRRNYNDSDMSQKGITWACINYDHPNQAVPYFPTGSEVCPDGLRAQVTFPQCWDGKNLDSPDHASHVAYPIQAPDLGDCPANFPVRLPLLFYEVLFNIDPTVFPHGNGRQPLVLSCGDGSGYGLHGDFLNGWDPTIMQNALQDVSCFDNNTNGNAALCKTLAPFVKAQNTDQTCLLAKPLPEYEDIGVSHGIPTLPGCQGITYAGPTVPFCTGPPNFPKSSYFLPNLRILLRAPNGLYVTAVTPYTPLNASRMASVLSYTEAFELAPMPGGGYSMQSEINLNYVSATSRSTGPLYASRSAPSTWETFEIKYISGTAPTAAGTPASIMSLSDNMYLSMQSNGEIWPNAATVGNTETFFIVDADAAAAMAYSEKTKQKVAFN